MSEMYAAYLRRTKGSDAERAYWERAELNEVITQLEAENAALREFVAAYDETFVEREPGETNMAAIAEEHRQRQRLATDYGIPLPGQEGEG